MRTLFVFNHPAPYKVSVFNELSKLTDIQVIFERESASDRPSSFYAGNEYKFPAIFIKYGSFAKENTFSGQVKKHIKLHHNEYDVIVMNGYSKISEMRAIKYMIKHHIPYVLQINGGIAKKDSAWKRRMKTYYISHASKYLSPCTEADNYLMSYGARKEDIYHYPYGNYFADEVIKKPLTTEEKKVIRQKWNLPEGTIYINPSQFIVRKNNIQLMSLFKDRKEHLLLVGSGVEKDKYLKYIKDNNLNNVHIMDFLKKKDLFELMQGCDYLITLSKEDIFGHTTLEGMANGLPVISSKHVVSSLDLIKDGVNGFLVDIENNESIIKAMDSIDTSMSMAAINTAKNNTIEESAKRINELLEQFK